MAAQVAEAAGVARVDYGRIFDEIFAAADGSVLTFGEVISDPRLSGVSVGTRKRRLRAYIDAEPLRLKAISGIVPKPDTVVAVVEAEVGRVVESNLMAANEKCHELVKSITTPMVSTFVREAAMSSYDVDSDRYTFSSDALIEFLLEDLAPYMRAAGNGLASIAGKLNEKLLRQAMLNAGMVEGDDFEVTGSDSEGDIVVHTIANTRETLGVEVKSYHARERLLRGLRDVKEPKVGVGYFRDPSEFNYSRTITLLQAGPAAIYMPEVTLAGVEDRAKAQTTNQKVAFGSALYRPIERFVSDMKAYVVGGKLPHWP